MINILMPVAGLAKRFVDNGFGLPKPLIPVSGTPMIKLAVQSLVKDCDPKNYRLIFVVREDHCVNHDIAGALKNLFPEWEVAISVVNHVTQGTLCSCLIARDQIPLDEPLIVYTPDVCYESNFRPEHFVQSGLDGLLLTFKANSPDHSYVTVDDDGIATRTAEKVVISNDAIVGVYCYKTGGMFLKYADEAIESGIKINNEFYVSPMYNLLIRDKLQVGIHRIEKMHVLGTPEDLQFYEAHVSRYRQITKFALCSDHSGFVLKEKLGRLLQTMGIDFVDFGAYSDKDSDHYDSLRPCVDYLSNVDGVIAIAICSTGQGFNIAANKAKGIRSALVNSPYTAEMARRHNAANFFCLPAMSVHEESLESIIKAIITYSFDGGRHATRIRRIDHDPIFNS
jgi:RpiB/LacA/LacB family sugar-phosphate isomerase